MSQKTTKKAKSRTTKRAIRKTGTKERKKATKKEVIRVKDINELVNYCERFFNRKPFEGASVDFHPKKPAFVFILDDKPDDNSVTKVESQ
jgi:hypothetical protein